LYEKKPADSCDITVPVHQIGMLMSLLLFSKHWMRAAAMRRSEKTWCISWMCCKKTAWSRWS